MNKVYYTKKYFQEKKNMILNPKDPLLQLESKIKYYIQVSILALIIPGLCVTIMKSDIILYLRWNSKENSK